MWDLPRSKIKAVSPALAGGFFTAEPLRKPWNHFYKCVLSRGYILSAAPFYLPIAFSSGFPCGSAGKESACNVGTSVWSLGWEDPLEKGKATHSSILAWRIPWTVYPKGRKELDTNEWLTYTHTFITVYCVCLLVCFPFRRQIEGSLRKRIYCLYSTEATDQWVVIPLYPSKSLLLIPCPQAHLSWVRRSSYECCHRQWDMSLFWFSFQIWLIAPESIKTLGEEGLFLGSWNKVILCSNN